MNQDTIITYGPTLARPTSYADALALIDEIAASHGEGVIALLLCRSYVPGISNVECAVNLDPERAIVALATATRQLAKLHGKAAEPKAVIDLDDEIALRREAERIVDLVRSCRFTARDDAARIFDLSREMAVREIMIALVMASRVRPAAGDA